MARTDEDLLHERTLSMARPMSAGNRMSAGNSVINTSSTKVETIVDENGKVRRKWRPGDPWDSTTYFGGGGL